MVPSYATKIVHSTVTSAGTKMRIYRKLILLRSRRQGFWDCGFNLKQTWIIANPL
jgi:hypothetical protein